MSVLEITLILLGYLSGAVPYGYLLTKKVTGLNILEQGSGNIGSTNVGRVAGKKIALLVQVLDMLKGLLPVVIVILLRKSDQLICADYFPPAVALSSVLGHNFSIFLWFRGGKGVNTTLGATLLLAPVAVLCSVAVYFAARWRFKYVSAGSLALAVSLPLSGIVFQPGPLLEMYLLICCCLIVIRHIPNLKRLIGGNELPQNPI